jgi:hypothetical protein
MVRGKKSHLGRLWGRDKLAAYFFTQKVKFQSTAGGQRPELQTHQPNGVDLYACLFINFTNNRLSRGLTAI